MGKPLKEGPAASYARTKGLWCEGGEAMRARRGVGSSQTGEVGEGKGRQVSWERQMCGEDRLVQTGVHESL